jgi:hypothetical protein
MTLDQAHAILIDHGFLEKTDIFEFDRIPGEEARALCKDTV